MVVFFRNMFQQTGFTPTRGLQAAAAGERRLRLRPLGTGAVGDDVFPRLVQNLQDSFALTAWQLVAGGPTVHRRADHAAVHDDDRAQEPLHPDRDAERPAVRRSATTGTKLRGRSTMSGNPIPLEQTAESDQPELHGVRRRGADVNGARLRADADCRGSAARVAASSGAATTAATRSCSSACSATRPAARSSGSRPAGSTRRSRTSPTDDVTDWQLGHDRAPQTSGETPSSSPTTCRRCARRPRWRWRCRASASTRRRRSWRCGTPTTATSTA